MKFSLSTLLSIFRRSPLTFTIALLMSLIGAVNIFYMSAFISNRTYSTIKEKIKPRYSTKGDIFITSPQEYMDQVAGTFVERRHFLSKEEEIHAFWSMKPSWEFEINPFDTMTLVKGIPTLFETEDIKLTERQRRLILGLAGDLKGVVEIYEKVCQKINRALTCLQGDWISTRLEYLLIVSRRYIEDSTEVLLSSAVKDIERALSRNALPQGEAEPCPAAFTEFFPLRTIAFATSYLLMEEDLAFTETQAGEMLPLLKEALDLKERIQREGEKMLALLDEKQRDGVEFAKPKISNTSEFFYDFSQDGVKVIEEFIEKLSPDAGKGGDHEG